MTTATLERRMTAAELLQQTPTVSYRQLDYWCRTGLIPGVARLRAPTGPGSPRLFTQQHLELVQAVQEMLLAGLSFTRIRAAVREGKRLAVVERDVAETS